jgi:hypothetical protein
MSIWISIFSSTSSVPSTTCSAVAGLSCDLLDRPLAVVARGAPEIEEVDPVREDVEPLNPVLEAEVVDEVRRGEDEEERDEAEPGERGVERDEADPEEQEGADRERDQEVDDPLVLQEADRGSWKARRSARSAAPRRSAPSRTRSTNRSWRLRNDHMEPRPGSPRRGKLTLHLTEARSMPHALDNIRFAPEKQLIEELFDRFGLEGIISHFEETGGVTPLCDYVLGTQLRLTPILAPRLCGILSEVKGKLRFEDAVDLFVGENAVVNAAAIQSTGSELPHVVSLTSGLVERMDDDELRFVLGHELGHLHFRHYRARLARRAIGDDDDGDSKMPPLLARRLETWERLAELSADRAGAAAVSGRLEPVVSAFFKIASGLGPEHLRFDIGAFLEQLADLRKLERRELLWRFSHPVTPIRVRALQLYGEAGGEGAAPEALEKVNAEVKELARLMEYEVTKPVDVQARDFLLAGGLLAAYSDGKDITEDQWQLLVLLLLPLSANPEDEMARIKTPEEARALLDRSTAWLRENAGKERYDLFRQLAHMVAIDGNLHAGEQSYMIGVAESLGIPAKAANETLYEVLAGYLQTQAARKAPTFGFKK